MSLNKKISNHFNLHWLSKNYKCIPVPDIIIDSDITVNGYKVGGCYYKPYDLEIYVKNKPVDLSNGLILVNDESDDDYIISTIAHEFRHHMQYIYGVKSDCIGWSYNSGDSYKNNIVEYFSKSYTELDALLYEFNMYKSDGNDCPDQRIEWIIESNSNIGKMLDRYIGEVI